MPGDFHPEGDNPVLEVLEVPEQGLLYARVAVPTLVLAAGARVQVEDGVDARGSARVHDPVHQAEPFRLDDARV